MRAVDKAGSPCFHKLSVESAWVPWYEKQFEEFDLEGGEAKEKRKEEQPGTAGTESGSSSEELR
jgi:hypothetical protein